jgi:hypothetical protein
MNVALLILTMVAAPVVALANTGTMSVCQPMPVLLHAEQPKYPDRESRVAVEGTVTLQFIVRPDGSVADPIVVGDGPALEAIARFKFAAVKMPCQGRTKIIFRVVPPIGTPNKSLERTRG